MRTPVAVTDSRLLRIIYQLAADQIMRLRFQEVREGPNGNATVP